jgi:hypothetical protein
MAMEEDVLDISLKTVTDLSALQYHFVTLSADNTVEATDNAADVVVGVLQNKPLGTAAAPAAARIRVMGISRIIADASAGLANGVFVGTNASGEGISKTADKARYSGICIISAAAGVTATMLVMPPHTLEAT